MPIVHINALALFVDTRQAPAYLQIGERRLGALAIFCPFPRLRLLLSLLLLRLGRVQLALAESLLLLGRRIGAGLGRILRFLGLALACGRRAGARRGA